MTNFKNGLKRAASFAAGAMPYYKKAKFAYRLAKSIKGVGGKRSKAATRKRKSKGRSTGSKAQKVTVHETANTFKKIQYKTTKLDKTASFIGGQSIQEWQNFGTIFHADTDEINSQKVVYLFQGYDATDVLACFNNAYQQLPLNVPLATAPTTGVGLAPLALNISNSYKFYIQDCNITAYLTNMSAGSSEITIYTVMAKNTKTSAADPINDWSEGQDDTSMIPGQLLVTPIRIGCKPTDSKLFNMNWRIVDKKRYSCGPGAKINYSFKFAPNNLCDTMYWGRNTYVKGMTFFCFAVTHGQVGLAGQAAGGGPANPYLGFPFPKPTSWAYNVTKQYRNKMVNHYPRMLQQSYSNLGVTVAQANPILVREDDGELES
ncbi:capsid protein [Blackfly DNA Virus 7]|nr:capsid protein [Blackfly DNA Virus 7]